MKKTTIMPAWGIWLNHFEFKHIVCMKKTMPRIICLLCLISSLGSLLAELVLHPDDNTLWLEDGRDIAVGNPTRTGVWEQRLLQVKPLPESGFSIAKTAADKGNHTACLLPVSPEYPWLSFQIIGFELPNGYRSWGMYPQEKGRMHFILGQTSESEKGLYCVNLYEQPSLELAGEQMRLLLYNYNMRLDFAFMKMQRKPENYLSVQSKAFTEKKHCAPGDELEFSVFLHEPAEDASIRFYHALYLSQASMNGNYVLQLKPVDEEQKLWHANVRLESITPLSSGKDHIAAGRLWMKALILGGSLKVPLWSPLSFPYYPKGK